MNETPPPKPKRTATKQCGNFKRHHWFTITRKQKRCLRCHILKPC